MAWRRCGARPFLGAMLTKTWVDWSQLERFMSEQVIEKKNSSDCEKLIKLVAQSSSSVCHKVDFFLKN